MAKSMTLRLDEDEVKALEFVANKLTWSGVKSKGVRASIMFLFGCMKTIKNIDKISYGQMGEVLDNKYATNIDQWKYR